MSLSLSSLKPITCRIPPVTGDNGSHPNASKVTLVNRQPLPALKKKDNTVGLQCGRYGQSATSCGGTQPADSGILWKLNEKEQLLVQESSTISSRREMMHLTAASLCFASLFFSASAEARPRNATMRQKIAEKLEKLKEKAGLSKTKDEGDGNKSKDNEAKKSNPTDGTYGSKVKSKYDGEGTKPGVTSQQTLARAPVEEPSVPMLPTLPYRNFLTEEIVETSAS